MRVAGKDCIVTQGDALSNIERAINEQKFIQDVGIIYIDPPYGGQQSDYPFMYSFAEEYVRQTAFESIGELSSDRKYTKKTGYAEDFSKLLSVLPKDPAWIFSYNDDSWGTKEEITKLIKGFKNDVVVEEVTYRYQQREDRSSAKEYLILAK
jgi:adenine-specific DNA methylase